MERAAMGSAAGEVREELEYHQRPGDAGAALEVLRWNWGDAYEIGFDRDVQECAYSVTSGGFPFVASAQSGISDKAVVEVLLADTEGNLRDAEFSLAVFC